MSTSKRPCRAVLLLGLTLACPLTAVHAGPELPPAPFPERSEGTVLRWRNLENGNEGTSTVKANDGLFQQWLWEGEPRRGMLFCWGCASEGTKFDEGAYLRLWPLTVGKSVAIERKRKGNAWTNEVTVVGTETLTLEFGTVDTYVVEQRSKGITYDAKAWSGTSRSWYAPSVLGVVRFENEWENTRTGRSGKARWELIDHQGP